MSRDGKRGPEELRPVSIVYERLDRVDGSARFGFGQTQAVASISGPIEVKANLESPSQATLDIHIRPLASVPGTDSRAFATTLKTVLTPSLMLSHHPRTLIQLVGQALCGSESGSGSGTVGKGWNMAIIASLINACSAAFINAGSIPMRGVVCAVAIGRLLNSAGGATTLVLDPSETELPKLRGGGCFAFLFSLHASQDREEEDIPGIALLWRTYAATNGTFDETEFASAQALARKGATEVWRKMKESLNGSIDGAVLKTAIGQRAIEDISRIDDVDDEKMEI